MAYIGNPLQSTNFVTDVFTGDGSTTAFNLSRTPASVTSIIVFVDGVKQASIGGAGAYTLSTATLNFTAAPPNNAVIEVIHLGVQSVINIPASATITANSLAPELRTILADQFTANGTGTTFALSAPPISSNSVIVTANGVVQWDYSVSGSTLIMNFTPANGTVIRAAGMGNILTTGTITDDSVSTAKLQALSVTTAKIADGAVTSPKIAAGAITGNTLATNIINANNIVDASITAAKLAPGAALSNGQLSVVSSAVGVIADSASGRLPYKILGQIQPSGNVLTTIYTVPASTNTMVTTITVCNQSANTVSVNVAANVSGSAVTTKNYIVTNYSLGAAETLVLEPRISLNVGSILSANITGANASSNISINAFGVEII
jgi:hypothetical protein